MKSPFVFINYLITLPELSYDDAARLVGMSSQTLRILVSSDLFRAVFFRAAKAVGAWWVAHWSEGDGEILQDIHGREMRRRLAAVLGIEGYIKP